MQTKTRLKNYIMPLAVVLCLASLIMMTFALCSPRTEQGEFVPPSFDTAAVVDTPNVPDGLGWQELDAKAYTVGVCGKFVVDGHAADVWLYNPASNSVWLKVRVLDAKGNVLGETGLIKPGEYVQSVALDTVPKTGSAITLRLMAYEPDTYKSAGAVELNTAVSGK